VKSRREYLITLVVFAVIALLPLVLSQYYTGIAILVLMWAFLATAWNILGGYGGQHSLGNGLFMGIGAYMTAYMVVTFGSNPLLSNPWFSMVLGTVLAGLAGAGIGWATFRYGLKGAYFALVTIALTEAAASLASNWNAIGAANGLSIPISHGTDVLKMQFASKTGYFYLILVFAMFGILLTQWLVKRRFGFRLVAVRENEDAAEALGVNTLSTKIWATALSGAMTAVGGTFYVMYFSYVDPRSVFGETVSVQILLFAIIGGLSTVWGPLVGAAVLVPIAEFARAAFGQKFNGAHLLVYGGVLIITMLFMPDGITGLVRSIVRTIRREKPPAPDSPSLIPEIEESQALDLGLASNGEDGVLRI
jgi:branched-chain amino acid transport system permease protein